MKQVYATEFETLNDVAGGTLFEGEDTSFAHEFTATSAGHLEFRFERPEPSVTDAKVPFF